MSSGAPAVIRWSVREELLRREQARRSLAGFLKYRLHHESRDGSFLWSWHLDYLCEVLQAVHKRQERRVIINIPPRFLKTELTVETFPAWMIGVDPSHRSSVLSCSFSAKLAGKSSRKTRDIITSRWFQALFSHQEIALDDAQSEKDDWELRYGRQAFPGAWRIAAGIEGTLTGRGADHLIWDDILKPKEANSDVVRTHACEFLGETLRSRHNDLRDGTIVGIMQRLHELDPTGYLLDQMKVPGADQYFHVVLPLENDKPRIYSYGRFYRERPAGELLHPDRMGPIEVAAMKASQLANFEGQYNQRPVKMEGNQFLWKRANLYEGPPPRFAKVIQAWDFALLEEEREDGCYNVCVTAGITPDGRLYILDVMRRRMNAGELVESMMEQWRLHRPYVVLAEKGQIELAIMPFLRRRLKELGLLGKFRVEGMSPGRQDKAERATSFEAAWNTGSVYLPKSAGWLTDYRLEVTAFPKSRFKDQVDASAYIGRYYDQLRSSEFVSEVELVETKHAAREQEVRITGDMQRKKAGLAPTIVAPIAPPVRNEVSTPKVPPKKRPTA